MHSRHRGSSGSRRPLLTENPAWVPLDREEVVEKVVGMAKEGLPQSQIGMRMRDQWGVPHIRLATGMSLEKIIRANGIKVEFPEDLRSLLKRAVTLSKGLAVNPRNHHARRRLHLVEAKILRLCRYYRRSNRIPAGWTYSAERAKLVVE